MVDETNVTSNWLKGLRAFGFALVGLFVVILYGLMVRYTLEFPMLDRTVIFYPFSLLTQSPINQKIFVIIIPGIFLFLTGIAKVRGAPLLLIFLCCVIGCVVMVASLLGMLLASDLIQIEAIYFDDNQYYLTRLWGGERWGYSSPIETYTILECDPSGLSCYYFSTPYLTNPPYEIFDESGKLFIENDQLYLKVGSETYPLNQDVVIATR